MNEKSAPMKLSVELTMYPFKEDYIPTIKGFVDWLHRQQDVHVETLPTCTIITGEHDRVMDVLRDGLRYSHEHYGKAVFVTKFLPGVQVLG